MPADDAINWELVRLQVRAGEMTRNRICAEHGITAQRLAARIKENRWDVDEDATERDRTILLGWGYRVLERLLIQLAECEMSETGEREGVALGRLMTSLDRMIALETRITGRKPTPRQSREMVELRAKIAKRLDELKIS
jgi:hypothetical protein